MVFWRSKEKTFRMVWKIERDGISNYLAGSAHFFPYSFRQSLAHLIAMNDRVLFEGPLDETNMNKVRESGSGSVETPDITRMLDRKILARIEREFAPETSPAENPLGSYIDLFRKIREPGALSEIEGLRPWMAFFKVWSRYIRKRGWVHSVDLEALSVAEELGKDIHYLETIDEQINAMDGIPIERIIRFFAKMEDWERLARNNAEHYLNGNIEALMASIEDFPSRCESIVDMRDPVMYSRMKRFLAQGKTIAFLGTAHIRGITRMLREDGHTIRKYEP